MREVRESQVVAAGRQKHVSVGDLSGKTPASCAPLAVKEIAVLTANLKGLFQRKEV
jgi:hypothetical protein